MNVGKFSVNNSVFINILMVLILVLGVFSVQRLPREQFAEIPFFFVNIIVPYPGVSAPDVEETVTVPIENEMQGLDNVDEISSVTQEGLSTVTIQFDQGLSQDEFDTLFQEVRNRFSNIQLPDGTQQETIDDFSSNDFVPVIEVVLYGDVAYERLDATANSLRDRLRTIQDVSSITLVGSNDREIRVEIDRSRLEARGVSLNEVVGAIRGQNITVPGGTLTTPERNFLLRTVGQISEPEEFERIVVRRGGPNSQGIIRVGDLGRVVEGFETDGTSARFNGQQAISLRVAKVPGGGSIDIVQAVRDEVAGFRGGLNPAIEVAFFNDSTIQLRDSLNVLVSNAVVGLVLLVVILLIFVGIRNAVITAVGIPIAFAITFVSLDAFGETLNSNTLFGLVLVLGLLVDHAIVIVENSYRLQQDGLSRREAALKGVNQVIVPVTAATLTTVAAFLPLTFLPGIIGRFLRVVPLTVSIALIASTAEAAVFLPSHYADWPGGKKAKPSGKLFDTLRERFRVLVSFTYRHRVVTLLVTLLIAGLAFARVATIPQDLFDTEDFTLFYVDIEMPAGTPISRTDEVVAAYEREITPLVGNGEVAAVNAFVGFAGGQTQNQRAGNVAQLIVDLTERDQGRERSIDEVIEQVRRRTRGIAGPEQVQFRKQQTGPPTDPPVSFRLFGDRYEDLSAVADAFKRRLSDFPILVNIDDNLDEGTPELRIEVDDALAARYGLSAEGIGNFIRSSFDGVRAGSVFSENEETDVIVGYAERRPFTVDTLAQLRLPTQSGSFIPFSAVAEINEAQAISTIRRIDGSREATVTAETTGDQDVRDINNEIERLFSEELASQYPGVELNVGGEFAEIADTIFEILRVFVIGLFLIYTILATQFKSYTQPLLILFSVPLAFIGVILYLLVSGTPLSTTVIYAGVALAGIAVNDTIVLLSFVRERRNDGYSVAEAVVDAASTRLRPILLTSITTIAGLLPTAIGIGGRSVIWGPLASTIIFGLLFSTVTALVVVPALYGLLYDRSKKSPKTEAS